MLFITEQKSHLFPVKIIFTFMPIFKSFIRKDISNNKSIVLRDYFTFQNVV